MSKTIKVTITRGKPFRSLIERQALSVDNRHYVISVETALGTVTDNVVCDRTGARGHAAGMVSAVLSVPRRWDLAAMAAEAGAELEFTSKG